MKTEPCCECGELVEHCAIKNSMDTFSEYVCHECGGALCDSCEGDARKLMLGDPDDGDIVAVCNNCYRDLRQPAINPIRPKGTPAHE